MCSPYGRNPRKKVRARFSCVDNFRNSWLSSWLTGLGRLVPVVVTVVTHLRFHRLHPLANLSPVLFFLLRAPRLSPPLNVRQVIYTRGFIARKILRKAVTRDRNATRGTASSLFFLPRTKNHFFRRGNVHGAYPLIRELLFERERERRKIVQADCESRR